MMGATDGELNNVRTQGERLAVLEYKINLLETQYSNIDSKLDNILELRQKGLGAFWLASALIGTGIIGFIGSVFGWFRPHV